MSFGPGDMGSTQYWHRQSFPLKVTLSPAGKGRLGEIDINNQSTRQRCELQHHHECLWLADNTDLDGAQIEWIFHTGSWTHSWIMNGLLIYWYFKPFTRETVAEWLRFHSLMFGDENVFLLGALSMKGGIMNVQKLLQLDICWPISAFFSYQVIISIISGWILRRFSSQDRRIITYLRRRRNF